VTWTDVQSPVGQGVGVSRTDAQAQMAGYADGLLAFPGAHLLMQKPRLESSSFAETEEPLGGAPANLVGVEGEAVPRSDGGSPIGDLLRPVSIPMQLLEWVARAYELCVGHEVARVGVPTNVLVAHEAVLMVEGEAFAREAVHVALAYELLADEVGRAPLNLAGRFFVQSLLNKGARARCGVYEHIARNPSIAKMHLPAPVFIIGLPRTGSTHLQSLLSADRMTETLKLYEMLDPLPLCEPNSNGARLRVGKLALQKIMMDALAPGWNAAMSRFHHATMDSPEEVSLF